VSEIGVLVEGGVFCYHLPHSARVRWSAL